MSGRPPSSAAPPLAVCTLLSRPLTVRGCRVPAAAPSRGLLSRAAALSRDLLRSTSREPTRPTPARSPGSRLLTGPWCLDNKDKRGVEMIAHVDDYECAYFYATGCVPWYRYVGMHLQFVTFIFAFRYICFLLPLQPDTGVERARGRTPPHPL